MIDKSISNIVKEFLEFERDNNLFLLRIYEYNLWEYIRYEIWTEIINSSFNFDVSQTSYNKKRVFHKYPIFIIKYAYNRCQEYLLNNEYKTILLNTSRRNIIDTKNVDIYLYPIAKKIFNDFNTLIIEEGFNIDKNDYPCDILVKPTVTLKSKLFSYTVRFSKKDKLELKKIEKILSDKFNVSINILSIVRNVIGYKIKDRKKKFKTIFKKYSPKVLVYVDDGSMQGVLEAAHEQQITTIELQHSCVSKINPQYQWHPTQFEYNTIPKYIFSFGEYWKNSFNLNSTITPIGFPYFDIMSEKYKRIATSDKPNNLIINSGIFSKNDLIKLTMELSEQLSDYNIYYKLRPEEYDFWTSQYPKEFIKRKNIITIDNNDKHLYEYFNNCKYQVGVNSTTIYEGLGYGLTTFILKSGWYEEMTPLLKGGYAFLVENATEITYHIRNNSIPANILNVNSIFRQNSLQTIRNEIDDLINKYNYV